MKYVHEKEELEVESFLQNLHFYHYLGLFKSLLISLSYKYAKIHKSILNLQLI